MRAAFAVVLVLSLAASRTLAQTQLCVGDQLPPIAGEFLTGRRVTLPGDSRGRIAVLFMGFTYASRVPVEAWGGWFRASFGTRDGLTFYEMPIIGGLAKLGRWFIDSGMRRGTPSDLHEHVITVYAGSGEWKARLGVTDASDKDAYVLLVDESGRIRWMYHGAFDETRAQELAAALQQLLP